MKKLFALGLIFSFLFVFSAHGYAENTTIYGCIRVNGNLRIVDSLDKCGKWQKPISWTVVDQDKFQSLTEQVNGLGVKISDSDVTLEPPDGKKLILNSDTEMKKKIKVEGKTDLMQELNVKGDTTLEQKTTVKGNAEFFRNLIINGRLALPNTAAIIYEVDSSLIWGILQPAIDDELASTVNIISHPSELDRPYLRFIPKPLETASDGTMMTLTYAPQLNGEIDLYAEPIFLINCENNCDDGLGAMNIRLKQDSREYEMYPGAVITLVNDINGIWNEISRSTSQIEILRIETDEFGLPPSQHVFAQIDCVTCNHTDDCNEKAVMITTAIEETHGNNFEWEIEDERIWDIPFDPADPFSPTYERYQVAIRNIGSGGGSLKLKARCMVP